LNKCTDYVILILEHKYFIILFSVIEYCDGFYDEFIEEILVYYNEDDPLFNEVYPLIFISYSIISLFISII
jgi:hypothetical protein